MSSYSKEIYKEYLLMHNLSEKDLPEGLFLKAVFVFPVLLIAKADGHIDTTELMFLDKLVKKLFPELSEKEYETLRQRIRILILELDFWKERIFKVLEGILDEEKKKILAKSLVEAAYSSSDDIVLNILAAQEEKLQEDFISEEERKAMKEIAERLGLTEIPEIQKELNL